MMRTESLQVASRRPSRCVRWRIGLLIAFSVLASHGLAQTSDSVLLDFGQAEERLQQVSDALAATEANVRSKEELSAAARRLRLPEITGEIQRIEFKKTLELPLGSLTPVAEEFGISSPLVFVDQEWRTRPLVRATLPLYSGGLIPAAQGAARAAVSQADAERAIQSQALVPQLVQAYFGQQLSEQAVVVRRDTRDGLEHHLDDTLQLEHEGFATKAQRLQAVVARDQSEREYQKALNDLASVRAALAILLRAGGDVTPISPLFVNSGEIGSLDEFRERALSLHPQIARLGAIVEQSDQAIRVQEATLKPQVFAFGQYDLHRSDALLTEPDWVLGIGLRYTFLSGAGRRHRVASARAQRAQAEAGLREARNQITIAVTQAYNAVETAQRQFLLLESSIAQAEENVRLQELSFREGQSTSLDVIDARLALGGARIERAQAAYQYDVALAQLLEVSGQARRFERYLSTADKVLKQ